MAPFATLYSWPNDPRLFRTLVAAKINNLEIDTPAFTLGTDSKDPAWVAKFPLAKVPALETHSANPVYIAESSAIAYFVADSGPGREQLLGSSTSPAERGKIQQWIFHSEHEVSINIFTGVRPKIGRAPYVQETEQKAAAALDRFFTYVEAHLAKNKWLAETKELSLADLTVAGALYAGLKLWLGSEWRAKYPKTIEWYLRTIESENVKEVFGEKQFLQE